MTEQRHSRGRRFFVALAAAVALGLTFTPALAYASPNMFELDGNIAWNQTSQYDWGNLFTSTGRQAVLPSSGNGLLASTFIADLQVGGKDASAFTNGSHDVNDIATWACTSQPVLSKDDILNTYAAVVLPASGARAGHRILVMGQERAGNNGDSFAGFWLLQSPITCGSGAFSGHHHDGDLLVVSNYVNGGGTNSVLIYRWNGGATGGLGATPVESGNQCANGTLTGGVCSIANNAALAPTTWAPGQSRDVNEFVESGIDLSSLPTPPPCFSRFVSETRSSQSTTAELHDFAMNAFNTCPPLFPAPVPAGAAAPPTPTPAFSAIPIPDTGIGRDNGQSGGWAFLCAGIVITGVAFPGRRPWGHVSRQS